MKNHQALLEKLAKIKVFATDFDGVHTDGTVYTDQDGREMVRCSRKDGLAYDLLRRVGIYACVISKEANPVVLARCRKLGIDCHQQVLNSGDKLVTLQKIVADRGCTEEQALFIGDDINDIQVLRYVGVAVAVSDSHPLIISAVDYVTTKPGGSGAIREVVELLYQANNLPVEF